MLGVEQQGFNFTVSPQFCISDFQQMLQYPGGRTLKRACVLGEEITDED